MTTIRVVGIDAAFANMGLARAALTVHDRKVVAFDCLDLELISTEKEGGKTVRVSSEKLRRAMVLQQGMTRYCQGSQFAFVEVPTGSQSAAAASALGIAVGVLASCPIAIIEVSPMEVKLAVNPVRKAKVSKDDVIKWAHKRWPAAPWVIHKSNGKTFKKGELQNCNEHLADALASIEAGIATPEFQRLLAMMPNETSSAYRLRLAPRRVLLD